MVQLGIKRDKWGYLCADLRDSQGYPRASFSLFWLRSRRAAHGALAGRRIAGAASAPLLAGGVRGSSVGRAPFFQAAGAGAAEGQAAQAQPC